MTKNRKKSDKEIRKKELMRRIQKARELKETVLTYSKELERSYTHGLLSYEEYISNKQKVLKGKSGKQWENYYDQVVLECEKEYYDLHTKEEVFVVTQITMWLILGLFIFSFLTFFSIAVFPVFQDSLQTVTGFAGVQSGAPPVVSSVVLNSTSKYNNTKDNITVIVESTDAESEATKNIYSWKKGGQPYAVIYTPFERVNNSADPHGMDYAGYSNNGSVKGDVLLDQTGGYDARGALHFDGDDDWISFGSIGEFNESGNFTIMMWFYREVDGSGATAHEVNNILLAQSHGSTNDNFELGTDGNNIELYMDTQFSDIMKTYDVGIQDNQWYHIAVSYDSRRNAETNIYLNGEIVVETEQWGGDLDAATTAELSLGIARPDAAGPTGDFNGFIDEFMLFNHSLTHEQIRNVYLNQTDIISHTATSINDVWQVDVFTNDGDSDSNVTQSLDFTVLNTKPSILSLALNTTNSINSTFGNITATLSTNDSDEDLVVPVYNWEVNQGTFAVVNIPFELVNDSSDDVAYDYSGFGHKGDVMNAQWDPYGGYDGNGALIFDGVGTQVDFEDSKFVNSKDIYSRTMELRFKTNNATARQIIYKQGGSSNGISLYIDNGRLFSSSWSSSPSYETHLNKSISAEKWYHVAFVLSNGTTSLSLDKTSFYLDGEKVGTGKGGNIQSHVTDWVLGNNDGESIKYFDETSSTERAFNGTIDEFRIYNVPLTADQIFMHYNNRTDVIVRSMTQVGDTWNLTVFPLDRSELGISNQTYTHTIVSDRPNITSLLINTTVTANQTSSNITVHVNVTGGSYDYKTIYDWRKNGTRIVALNVPFEKINDSIRLNVQNYGFTNDHGEPDEGPTWNATAGHDGKGAYQFFAGRGSIDFDSPVKMVNSDFSFGVWIKTNSSQDQIFVQRGSDITGFLIGHYNNLTTFAYRPSGTEVVLTNYTSIADNQWHHIMVSLNNSKVLKLYIDGIFVSNQTASAFITSEPLVELHVGANDLENVITTSGTDDWFMNGTIDDLVMYNLSLSDHQIYAIAQNRTNTIVANETLPNQNWSVTAYSFDGYEDSILQESVNLTVQEDVNALLILGDSPSANVSIGTTQTNLSVTTNLDAVCKFANDGSSTFVAMTKWFNSTNNRTHTANVTSLVGGTLYRYNVSCDVTDLSSNFATTSINFSVGPDTTPPVVIGSSPSGEFAIGTTSTNLSITINETSICKYDNDGSSIYSALSYFFNSTTNLTHTANVTGLTDGNDYRYNISCADYYANNVTGSINFSVAEDITVPIIIGFSPNENLSSGTTQTNLSVTTNEVTTCKFANDGSSIYSAMSKFFNSTTNLTHTANVTGLTDGIFYKFNYSCSDSSNNNVTSVINFSVSLASNTSSSTSTPESSSSKTISDSEGKQEEEVPDLSRLLDSEGKMVECVTDKECGNSAYCKEGYCYYSEEDSVEFEGLEETGSTTSSPPSGTFSQEQFVYGTLLIGFGLGILVCIIMLLVLFATWPIKMP